MDYEQMRLAIPIADLLHVRLYSKTVDYFAQVLSTGDRTGLIDNVFTAARVGLVGYDVVLELAQYLRQHVDDAQTVWKAFALNVRYIDVMMVESAYYGHWQVLL